MFPKIGLNSIREILFFILLISLTQSCSSNSDNVVWHPIKENIPHYNNQHTLVDSASQTTKIQNDSKIIGLLHSYLNNNENIILNKLDVDVSHAVDISVSSIGDNRLIILDALEDRLIDYNLNSDSTISLAEIGRGPGDIMLSKELNSQDEYVNIAMGGGRIERFNCGVRPCQHTESIKTEYNPNSFTTAGDSLAILSIPTGFGGDPQTNKTISENTVKIINSSNNQVGVFGESYNVEGHWMLLRPLVNNGFVRYNPLNKLFILSYQRFPFLYIYNDDLKLIKTFELAPFITGQQKYWPKKGRIENVMEDHSKISLVKNLAKGRILVETRTKKNRQTKNNRFVWDHLNRYYIMNPSDGHSFFLGSKEFDQYTSLHPTKNNIILNKEGVLYQIVEEKVVVSDDN